MSKTTYFTLIAFPFDKLSSVFAIVWIGEVITYIGLIYSAFYNCNYGLKSINWGNYLILGPFYYIIKLSLLYLSEVSLSFSDMFHSVWIISFFYSNAYSKIYSSVYISTSKYSDFDSDIEFFLLFGREGRISHDVVMSWFLFVFDIFIFLKVQNIN